MAQDAPGSLLESGVRRVAKFLQARGGVGYIECEEFCESGEYSIGGSKKRGGFTIGGGAETMLTDAVSAKLEYRYTNFKSWKRSYTETGFDSGERLDWEYADTQSARVKMSEHSVRAVVSWRFGNLFE